MSQKVSQPDVSVIMSVYNTPEKWLRQSIESILNQTYKNFEFIIVIDSPTDDSKNIVMQYRDSDKRIRIIENVNNEGLTLSLNKAVDIAKGKYIARMDSDDISLPNRFEKQYQYMELHKEVVALGSFIYCVNKVNSHIEGTKVKNQDELRAKLLFYNAGIAHPTAFIRSDILKKIRYNNEIKKAQDYQLWCDLLQYGEIKIFDEVLLLYRVHDGQISSIARKKKNALEHIIKKENLISQEDYSNYIKINQVNKILHGMTEEEQKMHCAVIDNQPIKNVNAFEKYLDRIIHQHEICGEEKVNNKTLKQEISYWWLQHALRRARKERKLDMLCNTKCIYAFLGFGRKVYSYYVTLKVKACWEWNSKKHQDLIDAMME